MLRYFNHRKALKKNVHKRLRNKTILISCIFLSYPKKIHGTESSCRYKVRQSTDIYIYMIDNITIHPGNNSNKY